MKGLNLIINQYIQDKSRPGAIVVTRSSTASIVDVPYIIPDYSTLLDQCNEAIPQEWHDAIDELYRQERAIIKQRTSLMAKYKQKYISIVQPIIAQYPIDHPEDFI